MKLEAIERIPLGRVSSPASPGVAYLEGRADALPFYAFGPGDLAAAASRRKEASPQPRAELADALLACNRSLGAGAATLANAELLRSPVTLAVVTGQQTAPLTGPLYTILKAAATVALAERVRRELKVDCVPVFWAEGDDHDAAEISRVAVGYGEGGLRSLSLAWTAQALGGPVGDLEPPLGWHSLRDETAGLLPATEFREEVLDLLFAGTGEGSTLGTWFGSVLLRLFGRWGLVVAYSRHPALRLLWRGLLPGLVREAPALMEEVRSAGEAMRAAGFRPQLLKRPGHGPFFLVREGQRLPARLGQRGFTIGSRTYSVDELLDILADDPGVFSPGVSLRAVVQDAILPTVAYVGGLAEVSYLGQLTGVYRRLGVPPPLVAPRLFATLVEPGRARVLARHRIPPSRFLLESPERIFAGLVAGRSRLSDPRRWEAMVERSRAPLARFASRLPQDQAPLGGHLEKVAGQVAHLVREAGARVAREERAREEQTRRQIEETAFALRPEGDLMERRLSAVHFLNRYGPGFAGDLVESMPGDLGWHWILGTGGKA